MIIKLRKIHYMSILILFTVFCFTLALVSTNDAVTASAEQSARLTVIMYHHITENEQRKGKYTVTADEFESDLRYIKDNGYSFVSVKEIVDFADGKSALPEKPIMVTFDDGFESFYVIAYPLLQKYEAKAVLSVIGSVTERYTENEDHNINYSAVTWQEISELEKTPEVEISNHSYNMHELNATRRKGINIIKGETRETYEKVIRDDLLKMQKLLKEKADVTALSLAYPYGAYSKYTKDIVKKLGFRCSFTCEERVNTITFGNSDCLYNLGRYNRESGIASEDFFKRIK